MIRMSRLFCLGVLLLGISSSAQAFEASTLKGALLMGSIVHAALDVAGAFVADKSQDEVTGETRKDNMYGATVTSSLAAVLSVPAWFALYYYPPVATAVLGTAMAFQGISAAFIGPTIKKDNDLNSKLNLRAATGINMSNMLIHLGTFLGAVAFQHRTALTTPTAPIP